MVLNGLIWFWMFSLHLRRCFISWTRCNLELSGYETWKFGNFQNVVFERSEFVKFEILEIEDKWDLTFCRRSAELMVSPKKVVGCKGGSRYVEGCWGFSNFKNFNFPNLKIPNSKLPMFSFQHFKCPNVNVPTVIFLNSSSQLSNF